MGVCTVQEPRAGCQPLLGVLLAQAGQEGLASGCRHRSTPLLLLPQSKLHLGA